MSNISISGCERACVKFGKKGVRLRRGMRLCAHDIKQLLWRESPIRRRGMFPRRTLATPDAQSQCRMRLSLRAHTHNAPGDDDDAKPGRNFPSASRTRAHIIFMDAKSIPDALIANDRLMTAMVGRSRAR